MPEWYIENNDFTHSDLPQTLAEQFIQPYPPVFWYLDNDEYTTANTPDVLNELFVPPVLSFFWVLDENDFINDNFPDYLIRGAFANCTLLETAHIPESVKSIGEYSFRNTALSSVKIASDCTYSVTSFPEDCEIEYYSDPENESEGDNNE